MRLEGRVALITGAATGIDGEIMGIGGTSARLFAREGAIVIVTDIDREMGETVASQIRGEGNEAMFSRLDVSDEDNWRSAIEGVISNYGHLDILVNNAGIASSGPGQGTVEETTG